MKTALIIPAYQPDHKMLDLLEQFRGNDAFVPIVVDDGSSEAYRSIFDAAADLAIVLRHPQNRGKGAGLKTAMQYALDQLPECGFAITADADGQHKHEDILRVNQTAIEHADALVLGSRRMVGDHIPLRSRLGNGITRKVFSAVAGKRVYDTQTGLRAYSRDTMRKFVQISGDRYEYEINELLEAAQSNMDIIEVPIETVYIDENKSSHFNKFRDSFRIYMCILKFACSSLIAFGVDYVLVLLISAMTKFLPPRPSLLISVVCARIISGTVNFMINRRLVFKGDESRGAAFGKYALLALVILGLNYLLLELLTVRLGWALAPSKLLVEASLFTLSFLMQSKLVYRKQKK